MARQSEGEGLKSRLRALAMRHPRALLVGFCLLLWLPGWFALPPGDRDESRFAQATKQMIETGDFVTIRNGSEARNRKPIGIYWLQVGPVALAHAVGLARNNPIWPYRLPSLAGALVAVLAVATLGRRFAGEQGALLAAAMLAGSLLVTVEVHIAKTDAALLAATTLALLLLGEAYTAGRLSVPRAAAFWVALGAGVLLKGPITPLVAGLAALALVLADRRAAWLRALRPAWGVPLMLLLVLPWFVAIGLATRGAFYRQALGGDLGTKLAGGGEGHGAPPLFHLALLSLTLLPSGWAVLRALPAAWRARSAPATRLLLAWAGPSWIVFELVPTKLPHYPLPLAPALFLLASGLLAAPAPRWLAWLAGGLTAAAVAILGLGAAALPYLLHAGAPWLGVPALAAAALLLALLLVPLRRGATGPAALAGLLGAVPLYAAILGVELPCLTPLWIAPRVAAALAAAGPVSGFASAGYAEPSLMFLCGTETVWLADGAAAASFLAAAPGRAVLVEHRQAAAFAAASSAAGLATVERAEIDGFNYSNGRLVRLGLFSRRCGGKSVGSDAC
jgi:4-amino-4-deoxy-L-arabinose transferase-like glycosyltransferase